MTTTLFRETSGQRLIADCWSVTVREFEQRVRNACGGDSDYHLIIPALKQIAAQ